MNVNYKKIFQDGYHYITALRNGYLKEYQKRYIPKPLQSEQKELDEILTKLHLLDNLIEVLEDLEYIEFNRARNELPKAEDVSRADGRRNAASEPYSEDATTTEAPRT